MVQLFQGNSSGNQRLLMNSTQTITVNWVKTRSGTHGYNK